MHGDRGSSLWTRRHNTHLMDSALPFFLALGVAVDLAIERWRFPRLSVSVVGTYCVHLCVMGMVEAQTLWIEPNDYRSW